MPKKLFIPALLAALIFFIPATSRAADDNLFTFAVISDVHMGESENDFAAMAAGVDAINEKKPKFVFILGDLTASGYPSEFSKFKQKILQPLSGIPIVMMAGNHDFLKTTKDYNNFLNSPEVQDQLLPEFKSRSFCGAKKYFATFDYQGKQIVIIEPYNTGHEYYLYQEELDCVKSQVKAGALVFRHVTPYGLTCQSENPGVCGSSVMGQGKNKSGTVKDIDQLTDSLIAQSATGIFTAHTHGFHQGMCTNSSGGGSIFHLENGDFGTKRQMEFVNGWKPTDLMMAFTMVDIKKDGSIDATIYNYNPTTKKYAPQTKPFPATVVSKLTYSKDKKDYEGVNSICTSIQPKNADAAAAGGSTTPIDTAAERNFRTSPKLEIDIPGVQFSDQVAGESVTGGQLFKIPYLAQYIQGVYKYSLGIGTLIAIVFIMFAGLRWMTSFGNAQTISSAQKMMGNAVLGLGLLFAVYTILYFINPKLTQLNSLTIFAPKQEALDIKFEDNAPTDGATSYSSATSPGTSKVIEQLLGGPLPSDIKKCSVEAANQTAQKLYDLAVCVGGCHCAYTSSNFLRYIGCYDKLSGGKEQYQGNAFWLAALLDNAGWTTTELNASSRKNSPLGLLLAPGHVGISIGNGQQFQSAASKKSGFPSLINKKTGESCPVDTKEAKASPSSCKICAKVAGEEPWTGKYCADTQFWVKNKMWTSEYWKIVITPPGIMPTQAKAPCSFNAGAVTGNLNISQTLCDFINKNGKDRTNGE